MHLGLCYSNQYSPVYIISKYNLQIMNQLLKLLKELKESDYDYYYGHRSAVLANPFENHQNLNGYNEFIYKYFETGEKLHVFKIGNPLSNAKLAHTISVFFLGVLIYNNTCLKRMLMFSRNNYSIYFLFLWYLSCLYHDYAFSFESNNRIINVIPDYNALRREFDITKDLLKKTDVHINNYLFKNIRNYFDYSLVIRKKVDHGILAGLYLYDRLVKLREVKEKNGNSDLDWGKHLEQHYAHAAAAVAVHNIWLPTTANQRLYCHFGLSDLVNFIPIKIQDSPLLFLLGIADTIDPIKAFSDNHEVEYILSNLELKFFNKSIQMCNSKNSSLDFSILQNRADGLIGWLDVSVTKKHNYLKINFESTPKSRRDEFTII
jgi:hypothetical protein